MIRIFYSLIIIGLLSSQAMATGIIYLPASEEALFVRSNGELVQLSQKQNRFGMYFGGASVICFDFSREILGRYISEFHQFSLSARADIYPIDNLRLYFQVPYLARFLLIQDYSDKLIITPGFGDITTGAIWYALTHDRSPLGLICFTEGLFPTGSSWLERDSDDFDFPLGYGFGQLTVGSGISFPLGGRDVDDFGQINADNIIFMDAYYTKQFSRAFDKNNKTVEYNPGSIKCLTGGIAIGVSNHNAINFQYLQRWVDEITSDNDNYPAYTQKIYGAMVVDNRRKNGFLPYTVFIGTSTIDVEHGIKIDYWGLEITWPTAFRLFGFDF